MCRPGEHGSKLTCLTGGGFGQASFRWRQNIINFKRCQSRRAGSAVCLCAPLEFLISLLDILSAWLSGQAAREEAQEALHYHHELLKLTAVNSSFWPVRSRRRLLFKVEDTLIYFSFAFSRSLLQQQQQQQHCFCFSLECAIVSTGIGRGLQLKNEE